MTEGMLGRLRKKVSIGFCLFHLSLTIAMLVVLEVAGEVKYHNEKKKRKKTKKLLFYFKNNPKTPQNRMRKIIISCPLFSDGRV